MNANEDTPGRRAMPAEADEDDERMGSLWSMSQRDWQRAHWRFTLPALAAILVVLVWLNLWWSR